VSLSSVIPKCTQTKDSHWTLWEAYCNELRVDKYLRDVEPKLPFLTVFAVRLLDGSLAPRGKPIKAASVVDYLCTISEEISILGADPDPRYGLNSKLHVLLHQQYRSYDKTDPPPHKVKPIPIQLLAHAVHCLQTGNLASSP